MNEFNDIQVEMNELNTNMKEVLARTKKGC